MILLVGLGNPGKEYQGNRHNIGFMVMDHVVHHLSFSGPKQKFHGELFEGNIDGQKVMILKPSTFMNKSGVSVVELAKFYKISPEDIFIFHDDLDLTLAKVRVKQGGGHGGHNGLKSIDALIGKNYHRVRIGIDHPGHKDKVTGHVLKDFSIMEREQVDQLLDVLVAHIALLVTGKVPLFMTKIAEALAPAKETVKPGGQEQDGI